MKTRRLFNLLSIITMAAAGAFAIGVGMTHKKAETVEAATSTTVYYAVSTSYTVKCNVNRKGDGDDWATYDMTKTSQTYNGIPIYRANFTDLYNGLGCLQFQLYSGSEWKSQVQPISSWTSVGTYNGKMITPNSSTTWVTYKYDTSYNLYFVGFWSNLYIHVWNDYDLDTWPGTKINFSDANLKFNGQKLQYYSLTCPSGTHFIINDNAGNQSDTYDVTNNAYFWHNSKNWVTETGDIATAAKFVWDLNTARLNVSASGSVKSFSICGLIPSTWVSRYNALSSGAKGYVDSSTIYTYKNQSSSGADTTVSFAEIMVQLNSMASGGSNSSLLLGLNKEKTQSISIIIIISLVSIASIGGYCFLRKRKENN